MPSAPCGLGSVMTDQDAALDIQLRGGIQEVARYLGQAGAVKAGACELEQQAPLAQSRKIGGLLGLQG